MLGDNANPHSFDHPGRRSSNDYPSPSHTIPYLNLLSHIISNTHGNSDTYVNTHTYLYPRTTYGNLYGVTHSNPGTFVHSYSNIETNERSKDSYDSPPLSIVYDFEN
jgi:hypothetical protein